MTANLEQAREAIRRCRNHRQAGQSEAVLRGEFSSRLRMIFSSIEDEAWIDHYTAGAEARVTVGMSDGGTAYRFIDTLVGATTIEYEADLRVPATYQKGLAQVKDHVAGLILEGISLSRIRGILSDTVEWYVYDAELSAGVDPANCTAQDITLSSIDELDLDTVDAVAAERFVNFIRRHLARQQSRPLSADFLTSDLGLTSNLYQRSVESLRLLVEEVRERESAVEIATSLWSRFVDHLVGNSDVFRVQAYADEAYLLILARLLSANVLSGEALLTVEDDLKAILDGSYFRNRHDIDNMVELDYFGWLVTPSYVGRLIPIAEEIQRDLYAYDFSAPTNEDLFGQLMAQLARHIDRKLLGQEWTPAWLAQHMVERCFDNLPTDEPPRIVYMCCGSGTILAEVLKTAKRRLNLAGLDALCDVVTGFDIDPLAVSLAKTSWVVTLAAEISEASNPITIPIHHADSLFAITPVSVTLPLPDEEVAIDVKLDDVRIRFPQELLRPPYSNLFDRIVDWAYDEACDAQDNGAGRSFTDNDVTTFLDSQEEELPVNLRQSLIAAVRGLVNGMIRLAVAGRNGIWAFILRNTYRPALLGGQFNGLVSNPPWLAMSRVADNPYKEILTNRAELYGLEPDGPSFLHLELATIHLLHAVDRYLKQGAAIACLVPGTVFNGHHHEPFRRHRFLSSPRPIGLELHEIWQVATGTFRYPGAAVIARKREIREMQHSTQTGALATKDGLDEAVFSICELGEARTAWVLKRGDEPIFTDGMDVLPQQGADLMPRKAVCVEQHNDRGREYRVETPNTGSRWAFAVKSVKQLQTADFPGRVAPRFIHRMAHSENLLPFLLGDHCPPIAIPAIRGDGGGWQVHGTSEIRRMGYLKTARRFEIINTELRNVGKGKILQERIDERGKLIRQQFGSAGHLVIAGAGGKHICAACLPVTDALDLVIDQTLYWKVFAEADEAWFVVAMLNSQAMTEAIMPFNPRGDFGERHIHTLPYRIMPAFDPTNEEHLRTAELARNIARTAREFVASDEYLGNPERKLQTRRARLRDRLRAIHQMQKVELLCAAALGVTPS